MRVGIFFFFCLTPDFREMVFRLSPLNIVFIMKYITSITRFIQGFYHEAFVGLFKGLFCVYWCESFYFYPKFIYVLFYMCVLTCVLNQPCIPAVKPAWSWCITVSICSSMWFTRIFATTFVRELDKGFLFLWSDVGIRVMLAS